MSWQWNFFVQKKNIKNFFCVIKPFDRLIVYDNGIKVQSISVGWQKHSLVLRA